MNTNEEPPPEPAAYEIADFKERALARIADAFLMTLFDQTRGTIQTRPGVAEATR